MTMRGETLEYKSVGAFTVRLGKPSDEENCYWVTLSYSSTRLSTYEYDNQVAALSDFRLMCATIQNVLECSNE